MSGNPETVSAQRAAVMAKIRDRTTAHEAHLLATEEGFQQLAELPSGDLQRQINLRLTNFPRLLKAAIKPLKKVRGGESLSLEDLQIVITQLGVSALMARELEMLLFEIEARYPAGEDSFE